MREEMRREKMEKDEDYISSESPTSSPTLSDVEGAQGYTPFRINSESPKATPEFIRKATSKLINLKVEDDAKEVNNTFEPMDE